MNDFGSCVLFKKYILSIKQLKTTLLCSNTGKEDIQLNDYLLVSGSVCAIAANELSTETGLSTSKVKRVFVKKVLLTITDVLLFMVTYSSTKKFKKEQ